MSSSRPPETGTELPDRADLPDDDGASPLDLFHEGVGFRDDLDDDTDDRMTYAVPAPAAATARPEDGEDSEDGDAEARVPLSWRLADARDQVRPWSAWTLRAKLVASMLALFTLLSLATGAFTVVALERQLTGQVDDQLRSSMARQISDPRGVDFGTTTDDHRTRGPGDEGLVAFLPTRQTTTSPGSIGKVSTGGQQPVAMTTAQLGELQSAGLRGVPTNINITGLGTYRVQSTPVVDGGAPVGVFVVGLPMGPTERTISQMVVLAISTVVSGIILVALIGTWLVRRNLEPLRRLAATATKVSQTPLDSGKVALGARVDPIDTDTRTEVGQVGAAFNEMLDHVDEALNARHQSEQRVRQFVADASHELRTPLASIKGYAELSRREPDPVPPTVTHAMGRIESEADRMSSLVEDLLLLARLDAGRPLDEAPVDMSMLVINAVSDAHAASPGHRWDLDLPPEPVEVTGDGARLHQVVANLLANARTHTPDGTRVTTSVRPEGEWVRVAVHDDGPGVPVSLQPNVFERFARGDDARVRAGGSTGLGLSIVAAVSKAHGGRVELDSRPGDTTFSLLLPAAP
ncbi:cell wall metabolism sensor histidine kinase WalK [Terrabacter sp. Root181]|uniref:sensor histidine kinase n=1 Tax=Terrabacter sp. Root181 TaxID=1736484 RepID=UPI0006F232A4|nr:HAMP domain-containing sensor histidine kinase [Terrabacter sp. Root181]KRB47364.1 histidine kinase [Terrabacter sp. Root181]